MEAFMICGVCNGVKWTQIPDWDGGDNTANAVPMKGCTCPPEPKPIEAVIGVTTDCPHCGKLVAFSVVGNINYNVGKRKV